MSDRAIAVLYEAPHSYTGEDVVELSVHGSPVVLRGVVQAAMQLGARLAEPGEFTLRAHLNGRIDLAQAEAVADLVDAVTPLQARAAFDQLNGTLSQAIGQLDEALFDLAARLEASVDFPDEGYHFTGRERVAEEIRGITASADALLAGAARGRLIREGFHVAIVGAPNAGKSSLFNSLVGSARAIVHDEPGTTRDVVTETIDLGGYRVTLADTAGLRAGAGSVEGEGIARARAAARAADVVVFVSDGSVARSEGEPHLANEPDGATREGLSPPTILVRSKSDLPAAWTEGAQLAISSKTGEGIDALGQRVLDALEIGSGDTQPALTNTRHIALVERARHALVHAAQALEENPDLSEEFVLVDLQAARSALEEITGKRSSDDLLGHIFARFCIGK